MVLLPVLLILHLSIITRSCMLFDEMNSHLPATPYHNDYVHVQHLNDSEHVSATNETDDVRDTQEKKTIASDESQEISNVKRPKQKVQLQTKENEMSALSTNTRGNHTIKRVRIKKVKTQIFKGRKYLSKPLAKYYADCKNQGKLCNQLLQAITRKKMRVEARTRRTKRALNQKAVCSTTGSPHFVWYDPSKQLCCNGVHDKISGDEICCGNKVYNERSILGCCNGETYDKNKQLCCNHEIHAITNPDEKCCGDTTFNSTTTISCCKDQLYDNTHKFCCDGTTLHHTIGRHNDNGRCCGKDKYDNRCFSCKLTSGRPTIIPIFDVNTQRCCHGHIAFNKVETLCCGGRLIDTQRHMCIDNSVVWCESSDGYINRARDGSHVAQGVTSKAIGGMLVEICDEKRSNSSDTRLFTTNMILALVGGGIFGLVMGCSLEVYKMYKRCALKRKHSNKLAFENLNHAVSQERLETGPSSNESDCNSLNDGSVISVYYKSSGLTTIYEKQSDSEDSGCVLEYQSGLDFTEDEYIKEMYRNASYSLVKPVQQNVKNLTCELFVNTETQTFQNKEYNQRDIFGEPYQHDCYLDKFNRTLHWENSDSKMTVPLSAVEFHAIHTQVSSFDDINAIRNKFCFSNETRLVSPVVEYRLTGCTKLEAYALVELPVLNDSKQPLNVWKFCSDEGMTQTLILEHVPISEKENADYDTYCIIEREKVLIYTKSFSGFLCTTHGERLRICMHAFLFGSYKKIKENPEVRLSLYIADELHKFTDYNQRMFKNETDEGRRKEAEKTIELPDCRLEGTDYLDITASVIGDASDKWIHKLHPKENRQIETEQKIIRMKNLSRCCQSENNLPNQVGWYLINNTQTISSDVVQCVVDITCKLEDQRADPTRTSLIVDELKLRERDRSEVLSDPQKISELKRYLVQMVPAQIKVPLTHRLNEFVRSIGGKNTIGNDLEGILNYLENNMNSADFFTTIVDRLRQMQEYKLLDKLVQMKYISDQFIHTSFQPCASDVEQGASNWQMPYPIVASDSISNIRRCGCRPEMECVCSHSFDQWNIDSNVGAQRAPVSQPRAELPTAYEDSDTEPKTLELFQSN